MPYLTGRIEYLSAMGLRVANLSRLTAALSHALENSAARGFMLGVSPCYPVVIDTIIWHRVGVHGDSCPRGVVEGNDIYWIFLVLRPYRLTSPALTSNSTPIVQ